MQGFNRYYPSNYDPKDASYKGNLNRLAGKAAQKAVVRFEMPFNIWCLSCDAHIAQGVRFNAEKKKTGNYYSSPIYSFTMRCHLCTGTIVIATNPKNTCYDVLQGGKKRAEEWNAQENGTFEFSLTGSKEGDADPIYKLEQDATQKVNAKSAQTHISQLLDLNRRQWADPYTQSQKLRRGFRTEKKAIKVANDARQVVADRHGLGIKILDPQVGDQVVSKSIDFEPARRPHKDSATSMFKQRRDIGDTNHLVSSLRHQSSLKIDPFLNPQDHRKRARVQNLEEALGEIQEPPLESKDTSEIDQAHKVLVQYGSEDEDVGDG